MNLRNYSIHASFFLDFFNIIYIFQLPLFAGIEAKKHAQKTISKGTNFYWILKENPWWRALYVHGLYLWITKDFPRSMIMFRRAVELNFQNNEKQVI